MDPKLYKAAVEGNLVDLEHLDESSRFNLHKKLTPCKDTVLHIATAFHREAFAKKAVEFCPSLLLQANSSGNTALHIAAEEGYNDLVEFFISHLGSSDIETGEYKGMAKMVNLKKDTALHCAARTGSYECVKMLVDAAPEVCSFVNNNGESPLYLLVESGSWIKPGVIINHNDASSSASHQGPKGLNALHASVLFKLDGGYGVKEIELLVKWRSRMIKERDELGMTPLHYAAFFGRTDVVGLFLNDDSTVVLHELINNDGESALHLAAYNGCVNTLKYLVTYCPDDCYSMVDKKGRTPLHAAVLSQKKEAVELILKTSKLKRLINKADIYGNTPLHLAAKFRNIPIIQIMIRNKKVDLNILNDQLLTPSYLYTSHTPESIQELCLGRYLIKKEKGVMGPCERANEQLKSIRTEGNNNDKEATKNDTKEMTSTNKHQNSGSTERMKIELEVNLLVAVLVATITLAAGFALPGGLVSNGEDEGLAIFIKKPAFKAFVVFNSLAFYSSIFVVGFHFINSTVHQDFTRLAYNATVKPLTGFSVLVMAFAFCCGSYVMLTKSTGLAVVPFILSACYIAILLAHLRPSYFLTRVFTTMQQQIFEAKIQGSQFLPKLEILIPRRLLNG